MTSRKTEIKINEDYREWLEALENLTISEGKEFTEILLSNLLVDQKILDSILMTPLFTHSKILYQET